MRTFRIDDISRDDAIQYLTYNGVGEELRGPIYDIVGGRMIHLKSAATDVSAGIPLDGRHPTLHLDKMAFLTTPAGLKKLSFPGWRVNLIGLEFPNTPKPTPPIGKRLQRFSPGYWQRTLLVFAISWLSLTRILLRDCCVRMFFRSIS